MELQIHYTPGFQKRGEVPSGICNPDIGAALLAALLCLHGLKDCCVVQVIQSVSGAFLPDPDSVFKRGLGRSKSHFHPRRGSIGLPGDGYELIGHNFRALFFEKRKAPFRIVLA